MTTRRLILLAGLALGIGLLAGSIRAQPKEKEQSQPADLAAMMERAKKFTEPGKQHKLLEGFLGKWVTRTRMFVGGQTTPAEVGHAEVTWLMKGRWMKSQSKGTMMGLPFEGFMLLGYDNFKQSYVTTNITNMDTAMVHSEGDLDPGGKTLLSYGTLDEYLTGEHDKMVKYVWRFNSPDEMVLEVHDLPIGENNTKVLEISYTRDKAKE